MIPIIIMTPPVRARGPQSWCSIGQLVRDSRVFGRHRLVLGASLRRQLPALLVAVQPAVLHTIFSNMPQIFSTNWLTWQRTPVLTGPQSTELQISQ